nr:hypothetical protein Iba_scaffold13492CG0230 [Ipomoea batatas]
MPRHLSRRCSVSLRPRRKRRWPLLLGAVGKNQEENTAVTAPESFYPAMAAERNLSPVNRRIEPCRSCPFRRRSIHLLFTEGERGQERASPNGPAIAVAFLGCDIHFAALLDAGRDERRGRRRDPAPPSAFGNTGEETRRHPLAAWSPPSSSQRRRRGNTSSSLTPAATTTNRRFVGGGGVNTAKMPRHLTRRCSVSLRPRRKRRWPLLLGAVGKNQEENTAVTAPESFYPAMAAERNLSLVNRRIEPCRSCPFRRRSIHLLFTEGERGQERASPNGPAIVVAFLGCDIHFAALLDAGRDERRGRRRDPAPPSAFGNTGEETRRHPLAAWSPPSSSQRRRRGNTSSSLPPAATTTNRRFVV